MLLVAKVCDALCGSGKTSAFIRLMNESTDKRFIFVTEFLSEVDRIKDACASRGFCSPSDEDQRKIDDFLNLIQDGKNIATTHALFSDCSQSIKEKIHEQGYTLILDETVSISSPNVLRKPDIDLLRKFGVVGVDEENPSEIKWLDESYIQADPKCRFWNEMRLAKSKNLHCFGNGYFYWIIPPDLFSSFEDVYVLTYMFRDSVLRCFFEAHGIDYEYIGVKSDESGYVLCPFEEMDRRRDLRGLIHIEEGLKLYKIGERREDLSFSWYNSAKGEEKKNRHHKIEMAIINAYKNVFHCKQREYMWTVYKQALNSFTGRPMTKSFVPFNKRASNEYINRKYLFYGVNNFPNPVEEGFYREHGVTINADMYAVSIIVQWIFRSAIRTGKEIWVCIPSKRMRYLLTHWIENLAEGKDLEPIKYTTERKRVKRKNYGTRV